MEMDGQGVTTCQKDEAELELHKESKPKGHAHSCWRWMGKEAQHVKEATISHLPHTLD